MKPLKIYMSLHRSVKVEEYKYNKIELGLQVDLMGKHPKESIDKIYSYLDAEVTRLLKVEAAKADQDKQTMTDMIAEGLADPIFK